MSRVFDKFDEITNSFTIAIDSNAIYEEQKYYIFLFYYNRQIVIVYFINGEDSKFSKRVKKNPQIRQKNQKI